MKVRQICPQCEKPFETEGWRHQKYCSIQCGIEAHKGETLIEKICPQCKKVFKSKPWQYQKFCSVKCGARYNNKPIQIEKRCLYCGKEFKSEPYKKQRFCSIECGRKSLRKENRKTYKNRKPRSLLSINGKRILIHRYLVEQRIERELEPEERVHHIDTDSKNNNIKNLHLYRDNKKHIEAHDSLRELIPQLLEDNIIGFKNGKYYRI